MSTKIAVTGAGGLVGMALVELLRKSSSDSVLPITRAECDLLNQVAVEQYFAHHKPDVVYHLAGRVYGIGGNEAHRAGSFTDNLRINTNVIDAAVRNGAKKIVAMGTGAVYPHDPVSIPLKEDEIFAGPPHQSEFSYAFAKRAMLAQLWAYEGSYDFEWAYVVSCNLFGPYDSFNANFGHVVPSLISRFYDAVKNKSPAISIWGNGSAQRDFLYSYDTADLLMLIADKGKGAINIGSGQVHAIREVVDALVEASGYRGKIEWDQTKPNGQALREYELSKINALGWKPKFEFRSAIARTYKWYFDMKEAGNDAAIRT